jgi:hypothetical protein
MQSTGPKIESVKHGVPHKKNPDQHEPEGGEIQVKRETKNLGELGGGGHGLSVRPGGDASLVLGQVVFVRAMVDFPIQEIDEKCEKQGIDYAKEN